MGCDDEVRRLEVPSMEVIEWKDLEHPAGFINFDKLKKKKKRKKIEPI